MKKIVLVAAVMLGLSSFAMAQDVPVAEVFGGYSFYRCNASSTGCDLHGWNAAVDFKFNQNWSAVADFSGHYGWNDIQETTGTGTAATTTTIKTTTKSHSFLFGPRYTFQISEGKVQPYVHGLFGINHVNPDKITADTVENNFAMSYGGGLNVKVNELISVRPFQLDFMFVRRYSKFENNIRYSAGIIFKFGKR